MDFVISQNSRTTLRKSGASPCEQQGALVKPEEALACFSILLGPYFLYRCPTSNNPLCNTAWAVSLRWLGQPGVEEGPAQGRPGRMGAMQWGTSLERVQGGSGGGGRAAAKVCVGNVGREGAL